MMTNRIASALSPLADAFKRLTTGLVTTYLKHATTYQTDPPAGRSGHKQEADDTYSPVGWRDQEYRSFLFIRSAGTIIGTAGAVGIVSLLEMLVEQPTSVYEVGLAVIVAPGLVLAFTGGVVSWVSTANYPETRRLFK